MNFSDFSSREPTILAPFFPNGAGITAAFGHNLLFHSGIVAGYNNEPPSSSLIKSTEGPGANEMHGNALHHLRTSSFNTALAKSNFSTHDQAADIDYNTAYVATHGQMPVSFLPASFNLELSSQLTSAGTL